MELSELRTEIDRVDRELISAFLKRGSLIRQVSKYKIEHELPMFAPERESEILTKMSDNVPTESLAGLKLLYGVLFDIIRFNEYQAFPQDITVPTGLGGASVRAILSDSPSALCRYLSPLAAAEVSISDIRSQSLPGGKLLVDIELVGDTKNPKFATALAVLADTAEKFTLI
jgi:hypothetical protein